MTIDLAVFAQVIADCPCAPFSPKMVPSYGGSGSYLIRDSVGPSEPKSQTASLSVQPFLHRWPQCVPILYNGTPIFPLKIALWQKRRHEFLFGQPSGGLVAAERLSFSM